MNKKRLIYQKLLFLIIFLLSLKFSSCSYIKQINQKLYNYDELFLCMINDYTN